MTKTVDFVESESSLADCLNNFLSNFSSKYKKAFTLAEVLVTLTIIGVVSAMTIPTLHQRNMEHATVNKIKKFYSTMSQAHQKAVSEYGDVESWGITGQDKESALLIYNNLFKNNFKIMVDCGVDNKKKCLSEESYYHFNGDSINQHYLQDYYYKMILNDGTSVWFRGAPSGIDIVFVDVNGPQKPNTWGRDLFGFLYLNGVFVPDGVPQEGSSFFDTSCKKNNLGFGCAAWVVYKGNMDYLHCDDLKWNGKQKCSK